MEKKSARQFVFVCCRAVAWNAMLGLILNATLNAMIFAEVPPKDVLKYEGRPGLPGNGKHVVLVSGDEEYRSEETVVQFGRILAKHHGFDCTILFAMEPKTGRIDPMNQENIPGFEALKTADVLVLALRFRNLPDEQMRFLDDYLVEGKPVLGIRTATHAFKIPKDRTYARYGFDYAGESRWKGGFGRLVLGETWIDHHGRHGVEGTRGLVASGQENHPIVRGCENLFGPTDVYRVRLPLPEDAVPIVLGQVVDGLTPDSRPVENEKNDPLMPIAWLKPYKISDESSSGNAFCSTIGSSRDFQSEGVRRLLVNAVYWLAGLEENISQRAEVAIVGEFDPLPMGFGKFKPGKMPKDFRLDLSK